ncbi:hypothetical protein Tco_1459021 [Tanacetum coccineum]
MTDKYCPQGEIKKLEIELWNLKVMGNNVPAYTERFQELTLICTKFVANEPRRLTSPSMKLPDNIYGNVKAAKPKTLDRQLIWPIDLMDRNSAPTAEKPIPLDYKRRADDSSRKQPWSPTTTLQKAECRQVYNKVRGEKNSLWRNHCPSATKTISNPNGPVLPECPQVQQDRHFAAIAGILLWECMRKREMHHENPDVNGRHGTVSARKDEDNSKETDRGQYQSSRYLPEVFPEDLPGLPPARPMSTDYRRVKKTDSKESLSTSEDSIDFIDQLQGFQYLFEDRSEIRKHQVNKFDRDKRKENAFSVIKQKLCIAPIPTLNPREQRLRERSDLQVLAKVGKVAYRLELPQELSRVHHTFHVSNLKKCYADEPLVMPLEGDQVDDKLQFCGRA